MVGLAGAALLVAAGTMAALANFVPWPVAAGMGALSGAAGMTGGVQLQRRAARQSREAAWAATVSAGPVDRTTNGFGGESILGLLLPEYRIVPYSVRHQLPLRELLRWSDGGGKIAEPVLCVDGHPGCGKTRLLVEFAEQVSARCGWVRPGRGEAAVVAALALGCPAVLLVDDADTRDDVPALLAALGKATESTVRVVIAARTSQWWLTVRAGLPAHALTGLPYRAQLTVAPIVSDAQNQRQVFEQALRYFTPEGATLPATILTPQNPPPSILLMHTAAALVSEQRQHAAVDLNTVVADVFAHERTLWQRSIGQAGLAEVPAATLNEALLLAALVGAVDEPTAVRLLGCLPTLTGPSRAETCRRVADWLRALYPQRFPDWLAPHLPAVLIEQHAASSVANSHALASALAVATSADDARARRVFTSIGRARTHSPHADDALAAIIDAAPYPMAKAAITTTAVTGLPLDYVLAASLAKAAKILTTPQLQDLYRLVPERAQPYLLAATAITLLRLYLNHDTVDLNHPDTLDVRHNLAGVLSAQARYDEAATEFRSVLAAEAEVIGPDHPDTLATRHNLAGVLSDQGLYDEAADEYRSVLATQAEVLGTDHPDTLHTRHNLARVLSNKGCYDEAADEYRSVLATRAQVLGPDHPVTLGTRNNLAGVLFRQGHDDEAAIEFRSMLATQAEVLGLDHPDTLATRHNLAHVLSNKGRHDEAADEYRSVLATRAEVLGSDHRDTLHTRHNLAGVLFRQGRHDEAAIEFRSVLAGQAEVLGPNHPDTLHTRHNLAHVLSDQGRHDEAAIEFRSVLAGQAEVLGPNHPDTLHTRHNLAHVLSDQGRHDEAAIEFRSVLAGQAEVLGPNHPDTLHTRHSLAHVLSDQGRHDEAAIEFRSVLATQAEVLGTDHPDTLHTRHNLAHALSNQGRHDQAAIDFRSMLTTQAEVLGTGHPEPVKNRRDMSLMDEQARTNPLPPRKNQQPEESRQAEHDGTA
ncbi:hypothetical protein TPA0907_56360 [Micromonospora humidisoli]|uniref:tetratricopeptide repeat protein n=1 Tax=Micromonospora sp. AKA109 TaxID=2733865 RepID=UPI0022C186B9|nr:tetratricopeptide repeat protein [Micromonospora sp. AKA109]GHJ11269.1 hypothetical protein TPA0907_56360 [Micromonospora sp. AKA109]